MMRGQSQLHCLSLFFPSQRSHTLRATFTVAVIGVLLLGVGVSLVSIQQSPIDSSHTVGSLMRLGLAPADAELLAGALTRGDTENPNGKYRPTIVAVRPLLDPMGEIAFPNQRVFELRCDPNVPPSKQGQALLFRVPGLLCVVGAVWNTRNTRARLGRASVTSIVKVRAAKSP